MNKRIKKKVIKKAIIKYNNKELLSKKEYKLIKPYIVLSQFDFKSFFKSVEKVVNNVIDFIVKTVKEVENFIKRISIAIKTIEPAIDTDIKTYYGGYNLND